MKTFHQFCEATMMVQPTPVVPPSPRPRCANCGEYHATVDHAKFVKKTKPERPADTARQGVYEAKTGGSII